jgi:isopenicillin N synthase-like dioxygenase
MPSTIFTDDIPLASLEVVSLAALERNDEAEIDKLMAASTSAGFLYLDFEGSKAADLPERKQQILDIMKEYFEQPQEVKDKDSKGTMRRG